MGKRKSTKKIKAGLKHKPPDAGINNLTDIVNQTNHWKTEPPDSQISDRELTMKVNKVINSGRIAPDDPLVLKMRRLEREMHRIKLEKEQNELRRAELTEKN